MQTAEIINFPWIQLTDNGKAVIFHLTGNFSKNNVNINYWWISEIAKRHYGTHTHTLLHTLTTTITTAKITCKLGAVSIRKTVLPGMAIPMLKIRRPNGRLIFNMEIAIHR